MEHLHHSPLVWVGFYAAVGVMLLIDLFVFHKKDGVDSTKKALLFTGLWIGIAALFGVGYVLPVLGVEAATQYATGYIIEKLLSADNLAMFVMIFSAFRVKQEYQHRVLFWGIIGAFLIRGVFISFGNVLVSKFEFLVYIFALMLISGAYKMVFGNEADESKSDEEVRAELEAKPYMQWMRNHLPITTKDYGHNFMAVENGKKVFTLLFLVLCCVEITDVAFAVDSIPAILVISKDPFILITSNVMAILGLRALYFVLSSVLEKFHLLNYGIAAILAIVGLKMLDFGFAPVKYLLEVTEHFGPYFMAHWYFGAIVAGVTAWYFLAGKVLKDGVFKLVAQYAPIFGGLWGIQYLTGVVGELPSWEFAITKAIPSLHVPALVSFGLVVGILTLSIVLSVVFPKKEENTEASNG